MYKNKKISIVIPAHNEEQLIAPTIENVPDYVDKIYVINDCSTDRTEEIVNNLMIKNPRIKLIQHKNNLGVGHEIINGYKESIKNGFDIAVVAGWDNQMPLHEMPALLDPIANNEADYTKGKPFPYQLHGAGRV